ncbi:two component transcriptional regulator, winged helix family protein [Tolypothrix tenuis PCC 7101]|uniref:Two component transcriptional regulator, winged helix family protein n=1 Tax=Tolypothrix tenuis PCC 7101 TaxID=231146 RepID=A0A1Z4MVJ5_9CYAN|nr:response regulator transcription factor [Aulosira sp. FACHB-113]BAY97505.1 two component transcriptional regulator, winged helix family protein [Tolypothrix tenuis PCC 7101]BAZ71984.1 two component transcriptional regulator, winged helix family protein [Aulosira laxa NIES-50]
MRILLVEDDLEQLEPLQGILTEAGYTVDGVEDGETAQWLLANKDYDLLILDWMLPNVSGLSLCQQYRRAGKNAPVLMLTAKDTTVDKVMGLDAGADDYLVKPADLIELLARVRALGRRIPSWQGDSLSVSDLQLHLNSLILERGSKTVELSHREAQLLEYLMRHPNQILTRDQLEQALWEWGAEPESNALTVLVRKLRHRLQIIGAGDWIKTVYGMGYSLKSPETVIG